MTRFVIALFLLAACGDSPPPLSPADGAVLCLNQTASEYVACPEDVQLCWHLVIDAPQICPDDGVDAGGITIPIPDGGFPVLDGGDPLDAGAPGPDLSAEPDAFEPEPDAFVPALDPALEVWPTSGPGCDAPGEVFVGNDMCAFGTRDGADRLTGGSRIGATPAPYGRPIGEPCTANARPEGSYGDCRAPGVCFAGVCTRPCELATDTCTGTPFAGCEPVGHTTHGVCWGAP